MPHADPQTRSDYQRSYVAANREKVNARQREYRRQQGVRFVEMNQEYRSRPEVAERIRQQSRKYWRENWVVYKLLGLKNKARRSGLEFNLDVSDIVLPTHCPVFGIPLVISEGVSSANSPSVDRIDNTKGYIKGNVVVVSQKANTMKRAATVLEMRQLADFYERLENRNA